MKVRYNHNRGTLVVFDDHQWEESSSLMMNSRDHQRPPRASVYLGRKVARELGAHRASVAMRAGHLGAQG